MKIKQIVALVLILAVSLLLVNFVSWANSYAVKETNGGKLSLINFFATVYPFIFGILIIGLLAIFIMVSTREN